jgi:hypothetical protein
LIEQSNARRIFTLNRGGSQEFFSVFAFDRLICRIDSRSNGSSIARRSRIVRIERIASLIPS